MRTGTIFNIQHYAIHDGPGIRVTVFFKGCPLRCWWCHNPESQQQQPESFTQTVRLDEQTRVVEQEMIGKQMSVTDIMREIEKDQLFFDESGGGVTFSGGEPLMQPECLIALLKRCKEYEIHTALDTSGYAQTGIFESVIDKTDLFLYDLKFVNNDLHRKYTGASNRLILENLQRLDKRGKPVWIRFPVIPSITNTQKNIIDILNYITNLTSITQVNLLPYHRIADGKYQKFGLYNNMNGITPPSDDYMEQLQQQFAQSGIP